MTDGATPRVRLIGQVTTALSLPALVAAPVAAQVVETPAPAQESGVSPEIAFAVGLVVGALATYALIQYRGNQQPGTPAGTPSGGGQRAPAQGQPSQGQRGGGTRPGGNRQRQSADRQQAPPADPQGAPTNAESGGTERGGGRRDRRPDDR